MSFVYFNSWMPASLESAWTNAWGCVHVSGWSGLAAGLNNCLSSAAPPPPSSTPCVLIQSSCPGLFSSPLVTCVSSSRGAAGTWSHSSKGSWCVAPWPAGSGAHWQGNRDALVPAQVRFPVLWVRLSTMMTTRCIYTFFFSFTEAVISLLYESLMLAWLRAAGSCWPVTWFGVQKESVWKCTG